MRSLRATLALIAAAATLAATAPAGAVVKGSSSALGSYTVRLVGSGYCSGVAIARRLVLTARHCAYGMSVLAGGRYFRVAHVTRSATLDDGRRVHASGDSAILELTRPLPQTVSAVPVGDGDGATYVIAGYGTANESRRSYGGLREATLVSSGAYTLVDPHRSGTLSASACYGDSGGPVLRGGVLVGVVTRASYPGKRIACGYYTRWAPISVSGNVEDLTTTKAAPAADAAPQAKQRRRGDAGRRAATGLFGIVSAKVQP